MNTKLLWCVIAVLAAACAAEGYYIHANKKNGKSATAQTLWGDEDKWMAQARKNLIEGMAIPFHQFDELFSDEFFGRKFDPFEEMENFERKFDSTLSEQEKSAFGRSWNDWFHERVGIADISPETKTTDKEVMLSLKVPGLKGESLNVDVNDNRIRIAYDAKTAQDKKDSKTGSYVKSESERHFEKIMPIPEGADPRSHRIEQDGNSIRIIFRKRGEQPTKR